MFIIDSLAKIIDHFQKYCIKMWLTLMVCFVIPRLPLPNPSLIWKTQDSGLDLTDTDSRECWAPPARLLPWVVSLEPRVMKEARPGQGPCMAWTPWKTFSWRCHSSELIKEQGPTLLCGCQPELPRAKQKHGALLVPLGQYVGGGVSCFRPHLHLLSSKKGREGGQLSHSLKLLFLLLLSLTATCPGHQIPCLFFPLGIYLLVVLWTQWRGQSTGLQQPPAPLMQTDIQQIWWVSQEVLTLEPSRRLRGAVEVGQQLPQGNPWGGGNFLEGKEGFRVR